MDKEIGRITKNETTDIVMRIDDFGGRRGLTLREYVTSERYTGFTKAGVRIMASDFPKFKELVNSISEKEMKEEPDESGKPSDKSKSPPKSQKTLKDSSDEDEMPDY